jgi:predicted dehydrogenase
MLEREASNLDFVDICTPPCWHGEIALAALNQGLHVLCEKPLTTSTAEATALIQKAIQSERVVFPCHNYKHAPVVQTIRDIIQSGEIGRVRSVTLNTFRNTHAKGVDEWKKHWRREKKYSGGGIAMDHGSHTFYLAFDWMGAYPTAITAKMSNLMPHLYDTEDNLTAVLTFPEGLVHAHLSWTAGVRKVIYTIQGESGAITVDDDELQLALIQKTDSPDVAQGAVSWKVQKKSIVSNWMDASHVQWFDAMFQQFKTAIQRNDYVSKDTYDSFFCIEAITAAYRSAETGCLEVALSQGHGTRGA